MRTCPICGRQYSAPPAMSRIDGSEICPVCGAAEALSIPGISDDKKTEIIKAIEAQEIAHGRVEALA